MISFLRKFFVKLFRPLPLILILLLGGGVAASIYLMQDHRPPEARYKFGAVEKGSLKQTVSANGTLNPVTLVNVGTQVSGTVRKLHVDFNDSVKEGQILAELDDALLSAQTRQSAASLMNARAALDLAEANEGRMQTLFAQDYVSRQELDQAIQALKAARAQLNLAQAQHDKDGANLGYTIIRSPVSGVVVDRQVDVGQTVAASFQTPVLFKIAQDLAQMQIDSAFAEADVGNIRVGQPVHFNVDAFPDRAFKGEVRQVRLNPTTTSNVVTYNVVVSVDNPDQILLPGMTAYVNITTATRSDVLLLPNAALRYKPAEKTDRKMAGSPAGAGTSTQGGARKAKQEAQNASKATVYVLRDEQVTPVSVQLGITDSRNTEVLEGALGPGDQVIIGEVANTPKPAASGSSMRMRPF